jgi:hypothetical protein
VGDDYFNEDLAEFYFKYKGMDDWSLKRRNEKDDKSIKKIIKDRIYEYYKDK